MMKPSSEELRFFDLASRSEAPVLILGATGTGKSTLARQIHDAGKRKGRPFVTINLATLHSNTLESELFGHERGAFTGAEVRRVGRLESANGGTVFLDEVGELPIHLQARLLEFLHSQTISPVGSNRELKLDVRIIAATHRDLEKMVREGSFREDLFHRLRVLTLRLRSLFERSEEFDRLVHEFLKEACEKAGRSILRISESVAHRLENHGWPGNLRELRNVMDFLVLSCEGPDAEDIHLPTWFRASSASESSVAQAGALGVLEMPLGFNFQASLEQFEREFLRRALSRNRGRVNRTARSIGINKTTLIRRMKAYGLTRSAEAVNPITV